MYVSPSKGLLFKDREERRLFVLFATQEACVSVARWRITRGAVWLFAIGHESHCLIVSLAFAPWDLVGCCHRGLPKTTVGAVLEAVLCALLPYYL